MSRPRKSGRRMDRLAVRRALLLSCFMVAGSVIVAKAAQLQVVQHEQWLTAAEDQHRERVELPARRGAIYDRKGVPLALSHEMYQVSIAPTELRDARAAAAALAEGLGIPARKVEEAVRSQRRWVVLPGRYTAEQRQKVGALRGVYFDRNLERFYPQGDAGREVIGAVTRDGRALGGIEQQFDSLLRGEAGYSVLRRDARGQAQPAISLPVVPPKDGANIHLTIDFDLQEIADAALRQAIETTGSSGGDLLLSDPRSGEILAAVSMRKGRSRTLTAITEPYEPGSTLKPFLAATLLAEGTASLADSVHGEMGTWVDGRRTFRDTSPHEWLSLRDALRVSSNIALVKFAKRLSPGQQYAYLRDFGFGTPTGIEYPAESGGRLRKPTEWSALSAGSLAMGYEISATPLQVVAAYGALANGGRLMEPYMIREVRASDGQVISRRSPTALRNVVPEEVTKAITDVLTAVVEDGTATRAGLATFEVAGKTGTSRRTGGSGGYAAGSYTSTFAGYFPAQDPQIVIFVKLDEPQGEYYGGLTAAPVTRETLQSILAASTATFDGRTLLATRAQLGTQAEEPEAEPANPVRGSEGTYVFLMSQTLPQAQAGEARSLVHVPALEGLSLREATRRAHAAGLRVKITGSGAVASTRPAEGEQLESGGVVTLVGRGG